jgi:hypothetical protein
MSSMKKFLMWVRVMKLLKITFFGYTYNFHPVILVLFPYSCLLYISHRTYDRYHRTRFLHHVPTVPDHLLPTQVVLRRDQLALKRGIEDEEGANNETGKGDGKPAGKAKAKARAKGKGKGKAKASAKSKGKASETPLADPEPESKVEGEPTAKRAKRTASKGGKKKSPEHEVAPVAAREADPPLAEQQPLPDPPQPEAPMEADPPLAKKADEKKSVKPSVSKTKPRRASSSSCSSNMANPPSEKRTRVSKGSKKEKAEPKGGNPVPEGGPDEPMGRSQVDFVRGQKLCSKGPSQVCAWCYCKMGCYQGRLQ